MTGNPRSWLVGGAVASVLLLVLGWLLVISPRMDAVAQTRQQAQDLQTQTDVTMAQVRQLQRQAEDLPAQIKALSRIQRQIPSSVDVPALLRDIQRVAARHDVDVTTLTPGEITVFAAETQTGAQDAAPQPETVTQPSSPPAPTPTAGDLGQGQLPEGVGLSYVPITITASGGFQDLTLFTAEIEELQRAYLITGVQLTRGEADPDRPQANPLTVTLETRVFVASDRLRELPAKARQELKAQS